MDTIISDLKKNIDDANNKQDYRYIKEQINAKETLTFSTPIKVLLMTDRLQGCAKGLKEYFENSTDITVNLVDSCENNISATRLILDKHIDFLIVVGYLRNKYNYNVVDFFRRVNQYSNVILFAGLDSFIQYESAKYGIEYVCNRRNPVELLVGIMVYLYDYENLKMLRAYKALEDDYPNLLDDYINETGDDGFANTPKQVETVRNYFRQKALEDIKRSEEPQTQPEAPSTSAISKLRRFFGL